MGLPIQEFFIRVICLTRLAELDHTDFEVVQRAFNQTVMLLIVNQQMVPKRMLWRPFKLKQRN